MKCVDKDCTNDALGNSSYCADHIMKCMEKDCKNEALEDSNYCADHQPTETNWVNHFEVGRDDVTSSLKNKGVL